MAMDYSIFLSKGVEIVRKKCDTIELFAKTKHGCIRIVIEPLCWAARDWIGDKTGAIFDSKSFYVDPDRGDFECRYDDGDVVDSEAMTAMKIAFLRAVNRRSGRKYISRVSASSDDCTSAEYPFEGGYAAYRGCVMYNISYSKRNVEEPIVHTDWANIYCAVSGADEKDDEKCALALFDVVEELANTLDDDENEYVIGNLG